MNKKRSVMLIDDCKIDLFINKKTIEKINKDLHILVFQEATKALNYLKSFEFDKKQGTKSFPEIIFLDINMPLMDGFQFLDKFKALKINNIYSKIYMLSSSACPIDIEKAKNNIMCKSYIEKPLSLEKLTAILK